MCDDCIELSARKISSIYWLFYIVHYLIQNLSRNFDNKIFSYLNEGHCLVICFIGGVTINTQILLSVNVTEQH